MPRQSPPRLTWLEHNDSWQTLPVSHHEGPVAEGGTGRVRICLRLEDGALMEIPMKQDTIDALADLFASLRTGATNTD
jgi:hypothetical protein